MARTRPTDQSNPLDRRFALATDAPRPWSWDEYEPWLIAKWQDLLATSDPLDEKVYQTFLEQHPCLLPGGEGTGESFGGHHGAWRNVLIAQPPLPGITKRIPDFIWLTKNSEQIIPVLIEIEAPGKPWFNASGTRSAKLTQAQDQLAEWRVSLDNEANRLQFAELYDFPRHWSLSHSLVPRFLLIYGRASEFEGKPELNKKRNMVRGQATETMTYDRLRPHHGTRNAISVRIKGTKAVAVGIPPTFRLGPANIETIERVEGLEYAITRNQLISDERRAFLLERLPYWRELARENPGKSLGGYSSGDWE